MFSKRRGLVYHQIICLTLSKITFSVIYFSSDDSYYL